MSIYRRVFGSENVILHDGIALKYRGEEMSYSSLNQRIISMAQRFWTDGLRAGERVLIFLPNCPEFIISFFAISLVGGVPVLADIKFNDELYYIFKDNQISWMVADQSYKEKLVQAWFRVQDELGPMGQEMRLITREDQEFFIIDEQQDGAKTGEVPAIEEIEIDDLAMILYTSGSTDRPKGVVNSHGSLIAALDNYLATLEITAADRLVGVTPFFHSYSFGSCMLAGLAQGATLLLEERFLPRKIMGLISSEQATIMHGVPYMYDLLADQFDEEIHSVESLRFCISAGAPLLAGIAQKFYDKTGIVIHQEYGSSETVTIALNQSSDLKHNIRSVGQPLRHTQIKITAVPGKVCGVLWVKNPGQSIGYVGEEPFAEDWYNTGDLVRLDEKGNIYIVGRIKRMINVAGLKVNPVEVEDLLRQHPQVKDVLVQGTEHPEFGEVVEALVVKKDAQVTDQELNEFCQKRLALYKIPRLFRWVDVLPKSSLGKIKKNLRSGGE